MSVRFERSGGLIIVEARIFGPFGTWDARLALDTGATQTMIETTILRRLGYNLSAPARRVRMTTANGVDFVPEVVLRKITALKAEQQRMSVIGHDLPRTIDADGLLGLDFFTGRRLTLDFREGVLAVD